MRFMKKILLSILALLGSCWILLAWYDFPYQYEFNTQTIDSMDTNFWTMIREDVVDDEWNLFNSLISLFHLSDQEWYGTWTWKAIYYAKWIINMVLWLVALISLVLIIFAFFMIFFSKDDTWITKAKQMIKWIALAIAVSWLSWFIVSIFFWIERWTTSDLTFNNNIEIVQEINNYLS